MSTEDQTTEKCTKSFTENSSGGRQPLTEYSVVIQTLTGTVKWFNNKAGFGFITVCEDGEFKDKDIFVHYSSIRVLNSQYKYLVQGEYVEFTLVKVTSDTHEFQAMNVSGVKGGPIMCEIRRLVTPNTNNTENRNYDERPPRKIQRNHDRGGFTPRPPIDNDNRRPRRGSTIATPNSSGDRRSPSELVVRGHSSILPPREPSTSMNGEDMMGFTKVERKRTARPKLIR
jgi:CspA family cold shock protein